MNLLEDRWIPVKRKSGAVDLIAPWQITEPDDPILDVNAVRPDFNGALLQFFIGLLQTAVPPQDFDNWVDWLEEPPPPAQLKEAMNQFREVFYIDGSGPRFMQDYDELDVNDYCLISALLMDTPGENAVKKNTDHFIKRKQAPAFCIACTATALFTLQTNAPSGGQGHRVSLRGGGPLTTLVALDPEGSELEDTLWRNIWLNIFERGLVATLTGNKSRKEMAAVFPWMDHARTSEKETGRITTPTHAHPLQMYWGMPRRIQIDWQKRSAGSCAVCGIHSDHLVSRYKTKNLGVDYSGSWQHPLSPHIVKDNGEVIPVHAQPEGLTYRHWLSFSLGNDGCSPALTVRRYYNRVKEEKEQLRLHVFGYDMDNMKARCWYETTYPLYLIPASIRTDFSPRTEAMTEAAEKIAGILRKSVKEAWFKRPGDAKGDTGFLVQVFYQHTEQEFYRAVAALIRKIPYKTDIEVLQTWYKVLRRAAMQLFNYWAEQGDIGQADPRRIAAARKKMLNTVNGKKIRNLLQVR